MMTDRKPTLEEVRSFLVWLLSLHGWIGEGDEMAEDLLAYIDGDLSVRSNWETHVASLEKKRATNAD